MLEENLAKERPEGQWEAPGNRAQSQGESGFSGHGYMVGKRKGDRKRRNERILN